MKRNIVFFSSSLISLFSLFFERFQWLYFAMSEREKESDKRNALSIVAHWCFSINWILNGNRNKMAWNCSLTDKTVNNKARLVSIVTPWVWKRNGFAWQEIVRAKPTKQKRERKRKTMIISRMAVTIRLLDKSTCPLCDAYRACAHSYDELCKSSKPVKIQHRKRE